MVLSARLRPESLTEPTNGNKSKVANRHPE